MAILAKGCGEAYLGGSLREAFAEATTYREVVEIGTATDAGKPMEVVAGLSTDSVPKAARSSGARYRSALTNSAVFLPKQPLSRRAIDRRRKDLVSAFVNALGGEQACSELTMVAVRRCAELQAMCEMARANMLNGQPTDMLALVRLEGVAARAIRQLGIQPPPAKARGNGLALARRRWAEAEAKKKAETEAREASAAQSTEGPSDGRAA